MNWEVLVRPRASKQLRKFPKHDQMKVLSVLEELSLNPYAGDISKMEGEDGVWRRRVGSYRIKYEIHEKQKIIYVFELERRTSSTY